MVNIEAQYLTNYFAGFLQHFGSLSYASAAALTSSASYPVLAMAVLMFSRFVEMFFGCNFSFSFLVGRNN
jgi:hypothetical protein